MILQVRSFGRVAAICGLALVICSCAEPHSDLAGQTSLARPQRLAIQDEIQILLTESAHTDLQLRHFYEARDYRPVWSGSSAARHRRASVMNILAHAYQQGLPQGAYPIPARVPQNKGAHAAAAADLELTRSLISYIHDVRLGRLSPSKVYRDIRLPHRYFPPAMELSKALASGNLKGFLRRLSPRTFQYHALVRALAGYRRIAADGGWRALGRHPTNAQTAARLAVEDPAFAQFSHPSASLLAEALRRFQARHGLEPDGVLGPQTKQALNVPVQVRIGEIKANLERWRWLPRRLPQRYVVVNVAAQRAAMIEHGRTTLESKVVIGRNLAGDTTPILVTEAHAIVANPVWTIPGDIASAVLLPRLKQDPSYLKSRHMELVGVPAHTQIDWAKFQNGQLPYQVIQLPGPGNALGNLMFDMPNHFDVYLHGTSSPALFDLANRARSHGCVRVQKISQFADLALEGSVMDPAQTLRGLLATGKTHRLVLAHALPIYLLYWTAEVEAGGLVAFWPDRYDRDPPLLDMLTPRSRSVWGPTAPSSLAPGRVGTALAR